MLDPRSAVMRDTPTRVDNRIALLASIVIASGLMTAGCRGPQDSLQRVRAWASDGWAANYEQAEREVRRSRRPMALYFKADDKPTKDPVYDALRSPEIRKRLSGYVHATLARALEPDRRYADQFGVERAPALILVHADGTFHALTGLLNAETIAVFIDKSKPPGAIPNDNLLIPRSHRYRWIDDLGVAQSRSAQLDRPMIVAYARRLTGDWHKLSGLLDAREVWVRTGEMVPCRQMLFPRLQHAFISPWGPVELPALVVVLPDGRHAMLDQPTSPEEVSRFTDAALRGDTTGPTAAAATGAQHATP